MKLALDIGNSKLKGDILADDNTLLHHIFMPSTVIQVEEQYHNYPGGDEFYVQILDSKLNHYDLPFAVGDNAMARPGYHQFDVTASTPKTDNQIATSLLFGALAEGLIEANDFNDQKLKAALSVPIIESNINGLVDDYRESLIGNHKIRVFTPQETHDVTFAITDVEIRSEGEAGFFGLLDQNDKEFAQTMDNLYEALGEDENPLYTFADFNIVDIGDGTTDIAVFRATENGSKFNPNYSYSVERGYGSLLEEVIANAQRNGQAIESRKDLQAIIEKPSKNKRREAYRKELLSYYEPVKERFIEDIVSTILRSFGKKGYIDAIILLGGGFTALTGYELLFDDIFMTDSSLMKRIEEALEKNKKQVGLLFGVPRPYAQTINERGLMQVVTSM